MRNKIFGIALCAMLFTLSLPAQAQQPARIPRIGILSPASESFFSARDEAFRQRLRELGMKERTLSLSTDMQKGKANGCLNLQPSWSVSKLTSSSPAAPGLH
jgi:hypothetical protein